MKYHRWSGPINVPDPVAISVADNGDVYVTQTQRRKIQDLDIRQHSAWIPDDVGLTSVEEKREFLRRVLPIGGDQVEAAKHVQDLNKDGQHDWRDLTVVSERIHRLVDREGDGVADEISLFAEDFRTEVTGIAAGIMHWNDAVWTTIAPDVWKLRDTNGDGKADEREVMATGFGLHIAYAGHDMHGLTIGPDGKVYWSIGDKGISVATDDDRRISFPNQGGVMRCDLDGSNFEVFAHGLRNVQEVAFDQYGNLFGVDNDADKPGEQERFVWIVDQMDAGWRCNYQYRGDAYNPWTDEGLWKVAGKGHAAYLVPPIQNYVDGPAGFKFNPGAALSGRYKDFFFLTSAPNGSQFAFRVDRDQDSFRMVDSHKIGSGDPIVGLAFAPDGGLYGVDWGGGYPLNQSGAVIRIDVSDSELSDEERRLRMETKSLLSDRFNQFEIDVLESLLGHVDQRVRMRAQFALAEKAAAESFRKTLANQGSDQLARLHSVWGLGQLIRSGQAMTSELHEALKDSDSVIRTAAVKTLGETEEADSDRIAACLSDSDLQVKVHATLALARHPSPKAVPALLAIASSLPENFHYLRHGIVTALAACAEPGQLAELSNSASKSTRLCAVLALRRQSSPLVAAFLADPSNWVADEASRAIHDDLSINDAIPALAESLDQSDRSDSFVVRAINANFRLGTSAAAERVLRFAVGNEGQPKMRLEACGAIGDWLKPPQLDRVDGRRRDLSVTREIDPDAATNSLAGLVRDGGLDLRIAAVKASRDLGLSLPADALVKLITDKQTPDTLRVESLKTVATTDSSLDQNGRRELLKTLTSDRSAKVAIAAIELLADQNPATALSVAKLKLKSPKVAIRQCCVRTLAKLSLPEADDVLVELGTKLNEETLAKSLHLDVWEALQSRSDMSDQVSKTLSAIKNKEGFAEYTSDRMIAFSMSGEGGDASLGEAFFRTNLRGQCSRCHRVGKKGSNIGPELTRIAKQRKPEHLLESIVYPSAEIEPKFNAQTILLADGDILRGVIQSEDDETTVIVDSKGETVKIPTDEIEAIGKAKVSLMPDMTEVLTPFEVRNLVAYLSTLR